MSGEIAEMLATKVRVMTLRQIAGLFSESGEPTEAAKRVVKTLRRERLATAWPATIVQIDVTNPLLAWKPGSALPPFASIGWANQSRWRAARPVATTCLIASDKGRAYFGGTCRTPRPRELEHDMAVAAVYLHLKSTEPEVAVTWRHEDTLHHDQSPRPDAIVCRDGQEVLLDVLGRGYSRNKIQSLWRELQPFHLELR